MRKDEKRPPFGSPEYIEAVKKGLTQLRELTDKYGFHKGSVMFLTGHTAEQVDDLGGTPDDTDNHPH